MCKYEPKKKDGFVEIEGVKLTASKDLPVQICAEPYSTHAAQENKAYTVDVIASGADAERVEFFFEV